MLHMNALIAREMFLESVKAALRPGQFEFLMRRARRQANRAQRRSMRHASYPYSSDRQHARYARQMAAGQLRFA
jgi:hypothetical protein